MESQNGNQITLKMAAKALTCTSLKKYLLIYLLLSSYGIYFIGGVQDARTADSDSPPESLWPTVLITTLIRNKAHALPWFFGQLENLNYPKDRIALWLRSDHNIDNSTAIVKEWLNATEHLYNSVDFIEDEGGPEGYAREKGPCDWTDERFSHVMDMREEALNAARVMWADYVFMLDADIMLENPDTLKILVDQQKTIVAPLMNASIGNTYSNFWGGMDKNGYYRRVPEYFQILEREKTGSFQVPMVHTVLLICMKHVVSERLSYLPSEGYTKAMDDIIIFAINAAESGVPMYIVNTHYFGHILVPMEEYHSLDIDKEQMVSTRMEVLDLHNPNMGPGIDYVVEGRGLHNSPHIWLPPLIPKDRLGFDQVYMINLERRPERRTRMLHMFDLLGIEALSMDAVDGKLLNDTYLYKELKIEVVPGFTDPYGGRPMTMGEIGCFLSHYFIWKDVVEKGYEAVVVFEDDLRFEPYFRIKLANIMRLVEMKVPQWDLIYLGRKRLYRQDEFYLDEAQNLVWPSYSYWTLSYLLSRRGAEKLLAQKPLQKLLPVDEYLPVMFNKHPEESWKEPFAPRDLVALSAEPLLIYPTHYLGEPNYISDTEYSELITETSGESTHNKPEDPQGPPVSTHSVPGLPGERLERTKNHQRDEL